MFTFSVHCGKNFPVRKQQSDLDVSLDEGLEDEQYLSTGTSTQQRAARRESLTAL